MSIKLSKLTPKERAKDLRLQREFHITLADYRLIFKSQDGCCGICKRPRSDFKNDFAVDHNHLTGELRGLLCFTCNRALGKFRDNDVLVINAAQYVQNPPAAIALGKRIFTAIGRIGTKVRAKILAGMKITKVTKGKSGLKRK